MKKLLCLLPFLFILSCNDDTVTAESPADDATLAAKKRPENPGDLDPKALFNINNVPVITVRFSVAQWNKLLTNYDLNPKNEKKVVAAFTYTLNGRTTFLDSIGLKLKGNTSRRRPEGNTGELHNAANADWHHFHFALDFSKNLPAQRFAGRNKLDLKWFKDDAMYAREVYCYDLFRRYGVWTAPRSSYCRVNVMVEGDAAPAYYGVYELLEHVDEDYIAQRASGWTATVGDLWKGGYDESGTNADFVQTTSIGIEDVNIDPALSEYFAYDYKTDEANFDAAKTNMIQFISDLNTRTGADFQNWISTKMDVPLFLKTYAVNVVVGMWDDYWVNGNNFYFYFASNGKAYFIPYDYDNTLGTSQIVSNSGMQNPLTWGPASGRPLITKILAIPEYQTMYRNNISELISSNNDLFYRSKSVMRIASWHQKISPYILNDTGEDMSVQDVPASWSNQPNYRLFLGNNSCGQNGPGNFFGSRAASIPW